MELKVSKAHFTTWFKNTFISEYRNGEVVIGVPNTFAQSWLSKKHHRDILHTIQNITNQTVRNLSYRVETKNNGPQPLVIEQPKPTTPEIQAHEDYGFTPTYYTSDND